MRIRLFPVAVSLLMMTPVYSADVVDANKRVQWLPSVTEGCYNDPANWTDGIVPSNGYDGLYGYINFQSTDVTVKAPPEGLVENSGTMFLGTGAGTHTLTIDTRGTYWEKRGVTAVSDWWGSPFCLNLSGTHIFNFEGLSKTANNNLIWRFDDALFRWTSTAGTKQVFDLVSGKMSFGTGLYLGSNGGNVEFNIYPEAELYSTGVFQQRGDSTTRTTFWGGRHSLNAIYLKDQNAGGTWTYMALTNDAQVTVRTMLHISGRCASGNTIGRSTAFLDLFNTSRMDVTNGVYIGTGNSTTSPNIANHGLLTLHDSAHFFSQSTIYGGYTQCSTGTITVADHTVLETGSGHIFLGHNVGAMGRLIVQDDGVVDCGGIMGPGRTGAGAEGYITLTDRARLICGMRTGNWMCIATGMEGTYARLEATDDSVIELDGRACVEMSYNGSPSRGELVFSGNAQFLGGTASSITNKSEYAGNTSISLADNALIRMRGIYGGDPVTTEPRMSLTADGGTLQICVADNPAFLSGCVATLGARGLTLDTGTYTMGIKQDFTAQTGASAAAITKVGNGRLVVNMNSDHPETHVAAGRLVFGPGVTRFGRKLSFEKGAVLEVSDANAVVEANEISFSGALSLLVPADYTLDEAHPILKVTGGGADAVLAGISVASAATGRAYAFSKGEDGQTISLTVTAATPTIKTWVGGASGSWNADANWNPAGAPTHNDTAVFAASASVTMDGLGSVGTIQLTQPVDVTIGGDEALTLATGVVVPVGAALELSAPLVNAVNKIAKTGKGVLKVSGDGAMFTGGWSAAQGMIEFSDADALCASAAQADGLELGCNTFRYTGEPTAIRRGITLTGDYPAIFDIVGDLTFNNFAIASPRNGFAKTGTGTLTLKIPEGTTIITSEGNKPRSTNQDTSGLYANSVDAAGDVVGTDWAGLAQFSVLDGRLVIEGEGVNRTTVKQEFHGLLGGSGVVSANGAELVIRGCTFNQGSGNGFHMLVDQQVPTGSKGSRLVLDNAYVTMNGLNFGHNKMNGNADTVCPVLAITNSELNIAWNATFPVDVGGFEPIVRVGAGGLIRRSSTTAAGGVTFTRKIDARFEDGGRLEVGAPQYLYLGGTANGEMRFARGGALKVTAFAGLNSSGNVAIAFDGGSAEFTENGGFSTVCNPAGVAFRADEGGGELIVGSGVTHFFGIPLRGEGAFTKTGAGTLVLTNDVKVSGSQKPLTYTATGSTTVKVACAGGVRIDEGTLVCVAGTTDAASRFSGTGVLSGEIDKFVLAVEPGAENGLTFADLAPSQVVVDFGRAAEDPIDWKETPTTVVAKVASKAAFEAIAWKGIGCGDGVAATFRYADGTVFADVSASGFMVILR